VQSRESSTGRHPILSQQHPVRICHFTLITVRKNGTHLDSHTRSHLILSLERREDIVDRGEVSDNHPDGSSTNPEILILKGELVQHSHSSFIERESPRAHARREIS
jgi:hypothetical protein